MNEARPKKCLTPREEEILALGGKGLTDKMIGQALGIGAGTVSDHWTRICVKLHVAGRTEAVAVYSGNTTVRLDERRAQLVGEVRERRQAEKELAREKRFSEALFEAMPGLAFAIDENGTYIHWNRNFEEFYGAERVRKEFSVLDATHPKDRERVAELIMGGSAGLGSVERIAVRSDGAEVPMFTSVQKFEWEGEGYGVGVSFDITERKSAEQALETQFRLQKLLMDMAATFIDLPVEDVEAAIPVSLGQLAEFVGADRARVCASGPESPTATISHHWAGAGLGELPEEGLDAAAEVPPARVKDALLLGNPVWIADTLSIPPCESRARFEHLGTKSWLCIPLVDSGELVGAVSFAWVRERHDLSAGEERLLALFGQMLVNLRRRKEAEEARRESVAFRERIFEASRVPVVVLDPDTMRFVDCNAASAEIYGLSCPDDVLGKCVMDLAAPTQYDGADSYERARFYIDKALAEGATVFEWRHVRPNGEIWDAEVHLMSFVSSGGRLLQFTLRDVTERRRADGTSRELEDRARRQQSAMVTLATHEAFSAAMPGEDFSVLTETACEALTVARASVWLLSEDGMELRCADLFEAGPRRHSQGMVLRSRDYPAYFRALQTESRVSAVDALADPRTCEFAAGYFAPLGISATLDAGIFVAGRLDGVVSFEHTGEPRQWQTDEEAFAGAVAAVAGEMLIGAARARVEAALQQREQSYLEIFNATNDAIYVHDAETGAVLDVNESMLNLYGFSREEALRLSPNDSSLGVAPWSNEEAQRWVKRAVTEGPQLFEWRARKKSGELFWVEVALKSAEISGRRCVLAVVRDITERKQAEEALRESEERYRTLFENAGDGIFLMEDGRFIACNARTAEMFACRADQLIGHEPYEFSPPVQPDGQDTRLSAERKLAEAQAGRPLSFEWMHTKLDGTPLPVEVSLNSVQLGGKTLIQVILHDATERKAAERRVIEMNEALERRVEERTTQLKHAVDELESFSYSASHDLRAPLRTLDGFSKIMLEDYGDKLDDEGRHVLSRIAEAAQRMGRLIDGMLALARASRGNMDRRTVDLGALAADVLARLREAEPDRDVTVRISEGMMVSGDPGLLRSLLENVLGNAWKYTGGQTNPCIEFTCEAQPSQVVFCVRDNGIGFDPAYADKLFVPFQRLHDAAEYQGEGIGLATAKRIVRRHGGEIWAEGAPGKGASFFFTLAT